MTLYNAQSSSLNQHLFRNPFELVRIAERYEQNGQYSSLGSESASLLPLRGSALADGLGSAVIPVIPKNE